MQESSLPPLSWLRSFEAAGRLLSFKQAASELCVSPSTISHQIRDLEDYLGTPLFVRGKQLRLTEEGRSYLSPVESGFELLRSAEIKIPTDSRFNIGAFPFLANEILTPTCRI
jgi:DNA-binding transcriptional LysR family regulator